MSTPTVTEIRRKKLEAVMCAGLLLDNLVDVRQDGKSEFAVTNGVICNTETHLVVTSHSALYDITFRVPWESMESFRINVGQYIGIDVTLS